MLDDMSSPLLFPSVPVAFRLESDVPSSLGSDSIARTSSPSDKWVSVQGERDCDVSSECLRGLLARRLPTEPWRPTIRAHNLGRGSWCSCSCPATNRPRHPPGPN